MSVGHAVNRSSELLACARTSLRISQEQQEQQYQQHENTNSHTIPQISLSELRLWQPPPGSSSSIPNNNSSNNHPNGGYDTTFGANGTSSEDDDMHYLQLSLPERSIVECGKMVRVIDGILSELQSLVRRRGHTNDPTEDIAVCMKRFQTIMAELLLAAEAIATSSKSGGKRMGGRSSIQRVKHYEVVSGLYVNEAKRRTELFQAALKMRSEVLKMQAQRRKMLSSTSSSIGSGDGNQSKNGNGSATNTNGNGGKKLGYGSSGGSFSATSSSQLESPLFTMTGATAGGGGTGGGYARAGGTTAAAVRNKHTAVSASPAAVRNGGVVGAASPAAVSTPASRPIQQNKQQQQYQNPASNSYSNYSNPYSSSGSSQNGMRQRHNTTTTRSSGYGGGGYGGGGYSNNNNTPYNSQTNDYNNNHQQQHQSSSTSTHQMQQQIQQRKSQRESKLRLENARQAEQTIASLGTMFSKMATLIQTQHEVIEKIEDDVEAAAVDVNAGHEEIIKLYGITKGNRGLILKVFALLIFFILFFKLY